MPETQTQNNSAYGENRVLKSDSNELYQAEKELFTWLTYAQVLEELIEDPTAQDRFGINIDEYFQSLEKNDQQKIIAAVDEMNNGTQLYEINAKKIPSDTSNADESLFFEMPDTQKIMIIEHMLSVETQYASLSPSNRFEVNILASTLYQYRQKQGISMEYIQSLSSQELEEVLRPVYEKLYNAIFLSFREQYKVSKDSKFLNRSPKEIHHELSDNEAMKVLNGAVDTMGLPFDHQSVDIKDIGKVQVGSLMIRQEYLEGKAKISMEKATLLPTEFQAPKRVSVSGSINIPNIKAPKEDALPHISDSSLGIPDKSELRQQTEPQKPKPQEINTFREEEEKRQKAFREQMRSMWEEQEKQQQKQKQLMQKSALKKRAQSAGKTAGRIKRLAETAAAPGVREVAVLTGAGAGMAATAVSAVIYHFSQLS